MKINTLLFTRVTLAALILLTATLVPAQTLTTLKSCNVADGGFPHAGLTLGADGMLYGINAGGGTYSAGTVFKVSTNGTDFAVLHHFVGGSEGAQPIGRVAVSGNTVYGVTYEGGITNQPGGYGYGTIYRVNTDGSNFSVLRRLDGALGDGELPFAGMVISGSTLFGTCADGGGVDGRGVVFKMSTNGSGYQNLHVFTGVTDGQQLETELTLIGTTLFGTTSFGSFGQLSGGTLFKLNLDGSGFSTLYSFTNRFSIYQRITPVGNVFYGLGTYSDPDPVIGSSSCIYKINTNGTGFQIVAQFPYPFRFSGTLTWNGSVLLGAASLDDIGSLDRIFQIRTNGTEFHVIKTFGPSGSSDPSLPVGDHVLAGTALYGTSLYGGEFNGGSVYRLDLRPTLAMAPTGAAVKISWPSYADDYHLEQSAAPTMAAWTNSTAVAIDDGTNRAVTFSPTSINQFYRLTKP